MFFCFRANVHGSDKNFVCNLCSSRFVAQWEVIKHERNVHGAKDFICDMCWQMFVGKSQLGDHLNSDVGNKTHLCVCGKFFIGLHTCSCVDSTKIQKKIMLDFYCPNYTLYFEPSEFFLRVYKHKILY